MFYLNHKTICTLTFVIILAYSQIAHAVWQPAPGTSWQWQLNDPVNNDILDVDTSFDVDMYDIDLFDTPVATIDALHSAGRKVICYFSAGSYEDWRDDADQFTNNLLGNPLDGWEGERWLDISSLALRPIMEARLDVAVAKNCDGVEPDNIDGYQNNSGFDLSPEDQLSYNRWLAQQAHQRGLSIGLKNDLDQVVELVNDFDWALNEQCFEYDECYKLEPFINAGKAVFGVEYTGNPDVFCPDANAKQFSWLKKTADLYAPVIKDCLTYNNTSTPLAATLQSPAGTITNNDPTYRWNAVSNSSWYYLWVNDSTDNVFKQWYTAEQAGCANGTGTCSINLPILLAAGSGNWWVQTWNTNGYGPWSAAKNFTVTNTSQPPPATSLISPNGDISDTTPTYQWNAVSNSSWYYLWVNDSTGNVFKQWYTAEQVGCATGAGVCSITPSTQLSEGNGQWWIQTWNSFGYGPWSTSNHFSLDVPELESPTLISPSGILRAPLSHDFKWNSVAGADEYYLWVNDSSGNIIKQWISTSEASCVDESKTCHFPAVALASGQGTWWVQARNSNGTSSWSPAKYFTVNNSISVPYDIQDRFKTVLDDSKLQGTKSNKVVERSGFADYSSEFFYLNSDQNLVFLMRGKETRSELRQLDEWYTSDSTANKMIADGVKLFEPETSTLNEYTWMQAHDSGSFNKPLIRLVWHRNKDGLENYLWAVIRHSSTIEKCTPEICTWEPLIERPNDFFKAELRIENNTMKVKIEDTTVLETDVSAWENLSMYFKAGVYLNEGQGEAEVQFHKLKYYN